MSCMLGAGILTFFIHQTLVYVMPFIVRESCVFDSYPTYSGRPVWKGNTLHHFILQFGYFLS
jgi:hypothetical protein